MIPVTQRLKTPTEPIWMALRQFAGELRVCIPAIVVSFNDDAQTVSVQPAVNEALVLDAVFTNTPLPQLDDVPICFPRAGGFALTMPISVGDECLIVFTDVAYDLWWQNGGRQNQPDGVKYRHAIGNGIAIFGVWNQKRLLSGYSTTSAQLRNDDGTVVIDVAPGQITASAPAVKALANGGTAAPVVTQAFLSWFTTNIMPFLIAKGYAGPPVPTTSLTTVFEAQ
jgi:hypothetical protein